MDGVNVVLFVLAICLIGALSVTNICFLFQKKKWKIAIEESFRRGKEEAAEIIKMTIDKVQSDKEKLALMSEKELMIETMLALGGQARRLDRMEERMGALTNYRVYVEEMNKQIKVLTDSSIELLRNIQQIENIVDFTNRCIQEANGSIRVLNTSLGNVGNIEQRVESISKQTKGQVDVLNSILVQVENVVDGIETMFSSYGEGPQTKLNDIEYISKNLADMLDDISSKMNEVGTSVDNFEIKVTELLEESLNKYGTDNLYSRLDDISHDVSSIRSTTDEALLEYGYNSLYKKIEEVKCGL